MNIGFKHSTFWVRKYWHDGSSSRESALSDKALGANRPLQITVHCTNLCSAGFRVLYMASITDLSKNIAENAGRNHRLFN